MLVSDMRRLKIDDAHDDGAGQHKRRNDVEFQAVDEQLAENINNDGETNAEHG